MHHLALCYNSLTEQQPCMYSQPSGVSFLHGAGMGAAVDAEAEQIQQV